MADAPDTAQLHAAFEAWYEKEHGIEWGDFATAPGGNYSKPRISVAFSAYRAGKAATPSPPVAAPPATPEDPPMPPRRELGMGLMYEPVEGFNADDMRAFVDADRAARTAQLQPQPQPQPAQPLTGAAAKVRAPLSDAQIEKLREETFSTNNPFCPCDSKTMRKAVWAAERAHGITAPSTPTPPEVAP